MNKTDSDQQYRLISRSITTGRQDVYYRETFKILINSDEHKLRIFIESDSYEAQCRAHIDKWNGTEWKQVHYISYNAMKTPACMYTSTPFRNRKSVPVEEGIHVFQSDRDELLRVACEILG